MRLFIVLSLLPFILFTSARADGMDDVSHLKGIHFFYMHVDTAMSAGITQTERLDLNDIMELQLRRGDVDLRAYILNKPELNVPLVELIVDSTTPIGSDEFELVLRVRDHVTINRNKEQTVATIFEMSRIGRDNGEGVDAIKAELRELMAEFVVVFREQNP